MMIIENRNKWEIGIEKFAIENRNSTDTSFSFFL
jgi:hypothetical protein